TGIGYDEEQMHAALQAGANGYVSKNLPVEQLYCVLSRVLSTCQQRARRETLNGRQPAVFGAACALYSGLPLGARAGFLHKSTERLWGNTFGTASVRSLLLQVVGRGDQQLKPLRRFARKPLNNRIRCLPLSRIKNLNVMWIGGRANVCTLAIKDHHHARSGPILIITQPLD